MDHFTDAIQKYAVFSGRAKRVQFWMYVLVYMLIHVVVNLIDRSLGMGGTLQTIYALALFIPSLAISVRRLNDIKRSPLWLLVGLVPVIGLIVLIVLFAQPSKK